MPNEFGGDTDDEVPDSPIAGVEEDMESEFPGSPLAGSEEEDDVPDHDAELMAEKTAKEKAEMKSVGAEAAGLGKRRDDEADARVPEPQGHCKRSRQGDVSAETPAFECTEHFSMNGAASEALVFTAPDGTVITAARKVTAGKTEAEERGNAKLLKEDIFALDRDVAQRRKLREEQATTHSSMDTIKDAEYEEEPSKKRCSEKMLVDLHRPKSFVHLLSDERTNRQVLAWLKEWDSIVHGTNNGQKVRDAKLPEKKILILYGPPGTGKTTLAHVLAKQAGYQPAEINASDERSTAGLKNRLDALVRTHGGCFTNGRPNCVIMDEIDGCLGAEGTGATDILLKYCRDSDAAEKAKESKGKKRNNFGGGAEEDFGANSDDGEDAAGSVLHDKSVKVGKQKGKAKAKSAKNEPKILQRPIICICNDLYVPALRNLRKEALLIKMTPPTTQRMVSRLQLICEREKLKADRQALTTLHELHTGDIRSCLNALQMLALQGGTIDMTRIRKQGGTVRDSQSGSIFDILTSVFRVAGSGGKTKVAEFKDDALAHLRHELKRHFSDMDLILKGCHQNYPLIKYTDPRMTKTARCLEALAESDVYSRQIASKQHWGLSTYLQLACLNFHVECASPPHPHIDYPRRLAEVTQLAKNNTNVWHTMLTAMPPCTRQQVGSRASMAVEVAPYVKYILLPNIKMQNTHLMSAAEKLRLEAHAHIMAAMGLSYTTSHEAAAQKELALEPAVDKIVTFDVSKAQAAVAPAAPVSQELMKYLQHLIRQQAMSKREAVLSGAAGSGSSSAQDKAKQQLGTPPTACKSALKSTSNRVAGLAGWGSALQREAQQKRLPTACSNTHAVRYKFAQGLTNAIKRPVSIKDLLG